MRFLRFILSHSIFIACCAAALCLQTNILLHIPNNTDIFCFVFFSTLCSYNFYWLLSKFYFSERKFDTLFFKKNMNFFLLFFIATAGTLFFLTNLKSVYIYVIGAVALTLLYSLPLWPFAFSKKLQQAGFLKTILLSFTWAYVTTLIPAAIVLPGYIIPVLILFIARFFFMLLLCTIFDMRDIALDKMHGLHSLATDVGKMKLKIIIVFVFLFYIFAGLLLRFYFKENAQMTAFIITGFIVWAVYRLSLKPRGYIFYYFLVDGLMLISALATFVASFF